MLARLHKAMEEREEGFTLIELLVVVIIIGILAAIAIPVFLSQRKKAYDSSAKSDLRNMAVQEEAFLAEPGVTAYGTLAQLQAATTATPPGENYKVSSNVTVHIYPISNTGYCAAARNSGSDKTWVWDSSAGGLVATPLTGTGTYTCTVDGTTSVPAI